MSQEFLVVGPKRYVGRDMVQTVEVLGDGDQGFRLEVVGLGTVLVERDYAIEFAKACGLAVETADAEEELHEEADDDAEEDLDEEA